MAAQFFEYNSIEDVFIEEIGDIIINNINIMKILCKDYKKYEYKETYKIMKKVSRIIIFENKKLIHIYHHYMFSE